MAPVKGLAEFERAVREAMISVPRSRVLVLQRWLLLEILARVVKKTPVDTGRTRANWQATIGAAPIDTIDAVDPSGDATVAKGGQALVPLQALREFAIAFITNNVPWIEVLEHGLYPVPFGFGRLVDNPESKVTADGFSKKAPAGMVAITLVEIEALIDELLERLASMTQSELDELQ